MKKTRQSADEIALVETTLGSLEAAKALARGLVEERCAACCHIIPISSCYQWKGEIEEAEEVWLRCKTLRKRVKEVVEYIQHHHPYTVPEIVVTKAEVCHAEYYEWLKQCVEG